MTNHNPNNERIKRKYFTFLKEAKRQNDATIDCVALALSQFEADTKYRDFKKFHFEQAVAFKNHLSAQRNKQTGDKLSKATLNSTMGHLKRFFQWLSDKPGYKSRLSYSDAEYFNLSGKDTRIAKASQPKNFPTLEQIRHVLQKMPTDSDIALRNRAVIAFTILTGTRVRASATLKLKHINLKNKRVYQDAREVRTKFSKTFTTTFFPVGDDIRQIVENWVYHLKTTLLWGSDDPLFPKTAMGAGENMNFEVQGLQRQHWSTTTPIRNIFKDAFSAADLPYYNPHSFRDTLVMVGMTIAKSPKHFKSWSQNLGHDGVLTSFYSYGEVPEEEQSEIIQSLSLDDENDVFSEQKIANMVTLVVKELSKENMGK